MTALPNKREILQPILDRIERGWHIQKPSPLAPDDVEELCIFQHPPTYREAKVGIPNSLFQDGARQHEIEPVVRRALEQTKRI